ncbi:hypothetical protein STEG23_021846 [Scotinomys teguina]
MSVGIQTPVLVIVQEPYHHYDISPTPQLHIQLYLCIDGTPEIQLNYSAGLPALQLIPIPANQMDARDCMQSGKLSSVLPTYEFTFRGAKDIKEEDVNQEQGVNESILGRVAK